VIVYYTCAHCDAKEVRVVIPERDAGVNLIGWLEDVMREVSPHHQRRSPACRSPAVKLRFPRLGKPTLKVVKNR
jgi:hypothetical protein